MKIIIECSEMLKIAEYLKEIGKSISEGYESGYTNKQEKWNLKK